jgi:hypothetical protein
VYFKTNESFDRIQEGIVEGELVAIMSLKNELVAIGIAKMNSQKMYEAFYLELLFHKLYKDVIRLSKENLKHDLHECE